MIIIMVIIALVFDIVVGPITINVCVNALLVLFGIFVEQGFEAINPLRAKFFRGNINIYLHFVSFLHTDTTQVVEIFPRERHEPPYST